MVPVYTERVQAAAVPLLPHPSMTTTSSPHLGALGLTANKLVRDQVTALDLAALAVELGDQLLQSTPVTWRRVAGCGVGWVEGAGKGGGAESRGQRKSGFQAPVLH